VLIFNDESFFISTTTPAPLKTSMYAHFWGLCIWLV
jgi:hypothetical protein